MRYADAQCVYVENYKPEHTYTFTGPCVITGELHSVRVRAEELFAYRQGEKLQDAFKSLSAADREFLLSGVSPGEWDKLFESDDPDGDEDENS